MLKSFDLSANALLLRDLTKREFKMRYLGSVLGSYWNFIHPLIMIVIYTAVFSQVMGSRLGSSAGPFSYSIYLCSGLLAWNLFSETINRGAVTLLDNAAFIKKLPFPPVILFGATLSSAFINFAIAMAIFLVALMFIQPPPITLLLAYFVVIALMCLFALGVAIGLGCLNVFMRDVQQITAVIFQLWFWFTPIVYLADALPPLAKKILYLNPAYAFIEPLHRLMYFQEMPELVFWLLMLGWTGLSLAFGTIIYKKSIHYVRDHL